MKINILAIEKYLPSRRIASEELDYIAKGRKGRIEKNTGVGFRHHVSGGENVCEIGAIALQKAMDTSNTKANDLDLLIFCGASFDYPVPHNSVIIKSKITDDTANFPCLDIDSTCLSFLNALDIAHLYLQAGKYKRIAIVCSEIASKAITPEDEKVFGLFGDAAVAMIISSSNNKGYAPCYSNFINYPSGALLAHVPIGGAVDRGIGKDKNNQGFYFKMQGKKLIKLTLKYLDDFVDTMEEDSPYKMNDFDKIITHQTSKFGNVFFLNHYRLSPDKVVETLYNYGNCISASIPLGLEQYVNNEAALENKKILLIGSGAGLSIGGIVLCF